MANNTQHHIIKDFKRTADDTQLIQHIYTHVYTLFGGFGPGTEAPQGFIVNKNGLSALPSRLLQLVSKNLPSVVQT